MEHEPTSYRDEACKNPIHIEARKVAQGILGELAEFTTHHIGRSGRKYSVVRLVVLCDTCGRPHKTASVNRRNAVSFYRFDYDCTQMCLCEKNRGW